MSYYSINKQEENKDRIKSGIITAILWGALLLFIFFYTVKSSQPLKDKEEVTTMLINFGDNRNGDGEEEPANQEGSLASKADNEVIETISEPAPQPKTEVKPEPSPVTTPKKEAIKERVITGKNDKMSVPTKDKASSSDASKKETASSSTKKTTSKATETNSTTGNGDGKGNAAIGNLIKGRGTKVGTQGTGGTIGNAGDPLGGDGNGDSKIGVDRKLTGFIPGTMGRGGAQPTHNCTASGSITISYTVDKAGNVVNARRLSGVSDPCVVTATVSWVKQYVKAEKSNVSSTGTYKITF